MADWTAKPSSIDEMLTMSDAPPAPGERIINICASFACSAQSAGIVHDIPCLSHFTSLPAATAAACSAVGRPGSAALPEVPGDAVGPELDSSFLSRPERLQSE